MAMVDMVDMDTVDTEDTVDTVESVKPKLPQLHTTVVMVDTDMVDTVDTDMVDTVESVKPNHTTDMVVMVDMVDTVDTDTEDTDTASKRITICILPNFISHLSTSSHLTRSKITCFQQLVIIPNSLQNLKIEESF